jgi:antitoxin MazE
MLTSLRTIGNSRGILIPATFLATCGMQNKIDMQLQDGQIILRPANHSPRLGWFDNASAVQKEALTAEHQDWAELPPTETFDDAEWAW